ncbi:TadE/TadG family type IV pilus assembly protein [Pedococcus sp. NPDC057267]|uniref:TadE/TadG family type IV pilus assembly protein n=1 Tax=Pedococcus sp. NPDC057267 TaxID=3346077 RepID=UPI003632A314
MLLLRLVLSRPRATTTARLRAGGERGSALVEFVFLAVLMMVPLIYLVMVLARLQAGSYAASAAVREAGRAYVTAQRQQDAGARADAAARIAFEDQGFGGEGVLTMSCDGDPCLRPDGRVTMQATVTVPLPLVPAFARDVVPLEVPVTASHVAVVDRFRGVP